MCKKKLMTSILVTTMVMSSTLTAFAADTTGSTSGAGSSEGHLEKEVLSMILPTIPSGSTPFAYTMDPERLIQETGGKKYPEGSVFPEDKNTDTGVYFQTADKKYENKSNKLQAVNDGSCNVTLTVKVKATASAGGNDIALATSSTPAAADTPELYLGLAIGKDAAKVVSETEQTYTKTIAGSPTNFEVTVDENKQYAYKKKANATTWKAIELQMEGAVSKLPIAANTTAPTVDVTWSYAKAANDATVDTADQVDYSTAPADVAPSIAVADKTHTVAADTAVNIPVNLGSGNKKATAVTSVKWKESNKEMLNVNNMATYADGTVTITAASVNYLLRSDSNFPATMVITFNDTESTPIEVTLNK